VKIWGLTEGEIKECVKLAGLTVWGDWTGEGELAREGRALHVRLCVDKNGPRTNGLLPFQKLGYRGRKTPYVTWEGHREFMLVVFERFPDARIKSAIADYKGRDDFFVKHPHTRGMWSSPTY